MLTFLFLFSHTATSSCAQEALIKMSVYEAQTRDVLFALAEMGNVNILIDDSVKGTVTVQLKDVSWEDALALVAKANGLTYHQQGNIIIVADARDWADTFGQIHFFRIDYADAATIAQELLLLFPQKEQQASSIRTTQNQGGFTSEIDGTGANNRSFGERLVSGTVTSASNSASVTTSVKNTDNIRFRVDGPTNTIIFKGSEPEARQIQETIARLDVPYKQVELEAQVVSLTKEASRELGVDWSFEATPQTDESVNQGSIAYGRSPAGTPYRFYFQAHLNALISKGSAKILAKPKITTLNGQPAKILIGERVPVLIERISNGVAFNAIEYIDTGIKLVFTPNVNTDSSITAAVNTEVSSPVLVAEMRAYKITTREAETLVRMKNGETMVIGGLIGVVDSETVRKVPLLSSIPLLGELFKSSTKSKTDTEVIIFLTASIVE
jgi:type IV pilus assembly protein PilQ